MHQALRPESLWLYVLSLWLLQMLIEHMMEWLPGYDTPRCEEKMYFGTL